MNGGVSIATVTDALTQGLPQLLLQFLATVALLAIGVAIYTWLTPYHERELVRRNNPAGGIVYAGTIIALTIPLAALLSTTSYVIDIVVWGLVALAIQLVTLAVVAFVLLRNLRSMIEEGNVPAALTVAATQIAVALINAAAMIPT